MTIARLGQLTAETQFTGDFLTDGSTSPVISNTKARTGTYSYRNNTTTHPIGLGFSAVSQIRAGYWLNHVGMGSPGESVIFRWYQGPVKNEIWWDSTDNLVRITLDGLEVASTNVALTDLNRNDTWMHVGVNVKVHVTTGFVTLYVDGNPVLLFTGDTGSDGIEALYFGGRADTLGGWSTNAYFDDFYLDSAVSELDVPVPSKRFLFSLVNAAGLNAEFTPSAGSNFQNVDDSGAPDGDTTYNKALSAALKDTFNTANVTLPADYVIRAAIILAIVKRTDASTASQLKLHSYDGSAYQNGAVQTPGTAYNTIWERQVAQPDATPWNETDFNAMQFGYESAGTF